MPSSRLGRGVLAVGLLLLLVGAGGVRSSFAFDFSANLQNILSGGEGISTQSTTSQAYRADDGIILNLTDAITARGGISYNRQQNSTGETSEVLTPNGSVGLHNDIFSLGLSGQTTTYRRTNSTPLKSSTWNISLSPGLSYLPRWVKNFHPALGFNYGESQTTATGSVDTHNSHYGSNLGLVLPGGMKFSYAFTHALNENRLVHYDDESTSHVSQLSGGGKFWQNRVAVKFYQSANYAETASSGIVPASGALFKPFSITSSPNPSTQIYAKEESTSGTWGPAGSPLLAVDPGGKAWDLAVTNLDSTSAQPSQTGGQPQLQMLRLAADNSEDWRQMLLTGELVVTVSAYTSGGEVDSTTIGSVPWGTPLSSTVTFIDHPNDPDIAYSNLTPPYFLIELATPLDLPQLDTQKKLNLKIHVYYYPTTTPSKSPSNNPSGFSWNQLKITDIEGGTIEYATPGRSYTNSSTASTYGTNFDMRLRFSPTLSGSTRLNTRYGSGFFNGQLSANLGWSPSPLVSPSLSFSQTLRHAINYKDAITRSYAVAVPVMILPTFNVAFGYTGTEQLSGGERTSLQNAYSFNAFALLYPELTAAFNQTYTTANSLNSAGTNIEGENYYTSITLQAQLSPRLTCSVDTTYTRVFKPLPQSVTSSSTFNFNYRVSEMMTLTGRIEKGWAGIYDLSKQFTLGVALLNAQKSRVALFAGYQQRGTDIARKNLGVQGGWDISKIFSLTAQAAYSMAETNTWTVTTALSMRL